MPATLSKSQLINIISSPIIFIVKYRSYVHIVITFIVKYDLLISTVYPRYRNVPVLTC